MKSKYILIILICYCITLNGQLNPFLKTFSATPNYNTSQSFLSGLDTLSKSSFITAGGKMRTSLNSNDTLIVDGFIQKTLINGLTKWFRSYHINGYTLAIKDIKVVSKNEMWAVGLTNDYGTGDGNIKHGVIIKTDSNGYVSWCRLFPLQKIYNVSKRSDGNIAVLASDSGSWFGKNLKVALFNSTGNLLWCKRLLSPDSNVYGVQIRQGINKSFIINSSFKSVILLDSNGNHIKDISYSPSGNGQGFYSIINSNNQNYYISGYNIFASKLVSTLTKTDSQLNIIWHKSYQSSGGDSEFQNLIELSPNNIMVLCEPENYGYLPGFQRVGLAFFDSDGVFKKSHLFTSDSSQVVPEDLIYLNNGNILFTAYSWGNHCFGVVDTSSGTQCKQTYITWNTVTAQNPTSSISFTCVNSSFNYITVPVHVYQPIDASIEYFCSNGPTGPLDPTTAYIDEEYELANIKIFPVPTRDFLFIELNYQTEKRNLITISLFNSHGRQVMNNIIYPESKYSKVDLRNFPNGIYYLTMKIDANKTLTKKIVITKD